MAVRTQAALFLRASEEVAGTTLAITEERKEERTLELRPSGYCCPEQRTTVNKKNARPRFTRVSSHFLRFPRQVEMFLSIRLFRRLSPLHHRG